MPATHPNARCYAMASRDDDLRVRPGRIRDGNKGARKSKSYVAQVMRAAKKAGHTGSRFAGGGAAGAAPRFGRGGKAARSLGLKSPSRRVVVKARVVRHKGSKFRSAPLAKHISYLKREGVTRDGQDARMFDARLTRRIPRPSQSAARRTGTTSASSSLPKTHQLWRTSRPSRAS